MMGTAGFIFCTYITQSFLSLIVRPLYDRKGVCASPFPTLSRRVKRLETRRLIHRRMTCRLGLLECPITCTGTKGRQPGTLHPQIQSLCTFKRRFTGIDGRPTRVMTWQQSSVPAVQVSKFSEPIHRKARLWLAILRACSRNIKWRRFLHSSPLTVFAGS